MVYHINCKGKLIDFASAKVMAILNVTQYSFFDGGKYYGNPDKYLLRAEQILEEGADIIDVGCMATNPRAVELSEEEELRCVEEVLSQLVPRFGDAVISVDTWRSRVARLGVGMGAAIVNDISGGDFDPKMFETVAQLGVPYILMHTSGKPDVMQEHTNYLDPVGDIFLHLSRRLDALRLLGVSDVIIDPGYGFGKTCRQNYELLTNQIIFKELGCPLLAGLSRKSMLYGFLGTTAGEALNATTVVNTIALLNGADMLRVHDVRAAVEAVRIVGQCRDCK
jgi:dihydropteroate synthase